MRAWWVVMDEGCDLCEVDCDLYTHPMADRRVDPRRLVACGSDRRGRRFFIEVSAQDCMVAREA